ncbi:MAG: hypothetical protein AAFW67_09945 [Cyanobacteria bacterium J06638_38]
MFIWQRFAAILLFCMIAASVGADFTVGRNFFGSALNSNYGPEAIFMRIVL